MPTQRFLKLKEEKKQVILELSMSFPGFPIHLHPLTRLSRKLTFHGEASIHILRIRMT